MLKELRIQDFAIIEELNLAFGSGLVILTGETGAGKSILLDAILTLVGAPGDMTFIRKGAERAIVEGTFTLDPSLHAGLIAILKEEDLLSRTQIYATDFNKSVLETAKQGIYPKKEIELYAKNYAEAGGKGKLSDYYTSK